MDRALPYFGAVCFLGAALACACSTTPSEQDAAASAPSDAGAPSDAARDAGAPAPQPVACEVTAPTSCPEPAPRYADVEPLFAEHCVPCHSGVAGGPWPLVSYGHVAAWFAEIRAVMLTCAMPPLDAGTAITVEEREQILTWIRCGYPP